MKKHLILFASLFSIISCDSNQKRPEPSPQEQAALAGSMQGFKAVLAKLLPIVIDSRQFVAKENQATISQEIENLNVISKQVVHSAASPHMDPSLRFISTAFSEDLNRAKESFASGQKEFARYTLMNVTAYCIECHTRTSSGPSFTTPQLELALRSLRPLEKAEYLLATRQFDQALEEFRKVIKASLADKGNLFELDKAVRYSLAITIRFQRDPKKSLEITNMIATAPNAPFFLKQSAEGWGAGIKLWMKEKPTKGTKKESDLAESIKFTSGLVEKGKKSQFGIADRGGDVYFLRALSDLHLLLAKDLKKDQLGEALYLTAVSYEAVRDLALWSLHENYYESCIRQVPHSNWSQKCYRNLEDSMYFGYTGSSGVKVPIEVQLKLNELKSLAFLQFRKNS